MRADSGADAAPEYPVEAGPQDDPAFRVGIPAIRLEGVMAAPDQLALLLPGEAVLRGEGDRNLIDFRLLPGQARDMRGAGALIEGFSCGKLLADRAFDANWLREALADAGIEAVIPRKSNRRFPAEFDRDTYKWRHLSENSSES